MDVLQFDIPGDLPISNQHHWSSDW